MDTILYVCMRAWVAFSNVFYNFSQQLTNRYAFCNFLLLGDLYRAKQEKKKIIRIFTIIREGDIFDLLLQYHEGVFLFAPLLTFNPIQVSFHLSPHSIYHLVPFITSFHRITITNLFQKCIHFCQAIEVNTITANLAHNRLIIVLQKAPVRGSRHVLNQIGNLRRRRGKGGHVSEYDADERMYPTTARGP